MKQCVIILSILLLLSAHAWADWADTFYKDYNKNGIDYAVATALGDGHNPDQIIKTALPIDNLEQEKLIKALFCALALPGSIYNAAEKNGITDVKVSEGYQLALAECAREMEENLNVEFNPTDQAAAPSPSDRTRGSSQASPWNFQ